MSVIRVKSANLLRRDTAAGWTAANPVLRAGEEGYETDTGRRKVGDGTSEWNELSYTVDQSYAPESPNAQSGKAVAEAVALKADLSYANNNFAGALKGSKSGFEILIDDVSPVEHEMKVRVSSDRISDLSTVKLIKSNGLGETITEYTPNADGTVEGVMSLYPNITLLTDTEGVIIDCEYNKDINKFGDIEVDVPTKTSELINDSNFATQDYVDEEIANFDFIKIVTELPEIGLINRTYFVPKQDSKTNDLYDEYMWVDNKWELIATKQIEVDLTEYAKKTEVPDVQINGESIVNEGIANIPVATQFKAGVVSYKSNYGMQIIGNTLAPLDWKNFADKRQSAFMSYFNLDYAVKTAMCDGKGDSWSAEEKAAARSRIGLGDYELIEEFTLEEEVSSVKRSIEPNGTAYSFKSLLIKMELKGIEQGYIYTFVYDEDGNIILFFPNKNNIYHSTSYVANELRNIGSHYLATQTAGQWGWDDTAVPMYGQYLHYNKKSIGKITAMCSNANEAFGIGTKFSIYGVRA